MQKKTGLEISAVQKDQILAAMQGMERDFLKIDLVIAATVDGFVTAAAGAKSSATESVERYAAIVSSLAALSEAGGKEMGGDRLDMTILNFNNLHLLTLKIKCASQELVLSVAASTEVSLGNLLWSTRETAKKIQEILSGNPE